MSSKTSKKKKISNEEKLSSVISDINAFTSNDRGKKSRHVILNRDIVLQRSETGVRIYPNRGRRASSQCSVKAKGITFTPLYQKIFFSMIY